MIKDGLRIVSVMLLTIVARVSGFAREITLASVYGATFVTDAYIVSTTIPSVIFTGIGMALSSVVISMYPVVLQKQGRAGAESFINNLLSITLVAAIITCALSMLLVRPVVSVFAIGFKEEIFETTVGFTRVVLPGIIFIGLSSVLAGYLDSNRKYEVSVLIKLPYNLLVIGCILVSSVSCIQVLLYGTLAGLALQTAIQVYSTHRTGYTFRFTINLKDKNIQRLLLLIMPVFIGIAAQQLNVLIDKTLASTLSTGSVSALNYAEKLISFVYGVLILSVITVVYPNISGLVANEAVDGLKACIVQSINTIIVLIVPLSAGAMCLSLPIVSALFQRGSFDINAAVLTADALFFYSIGLTGLGLSGFLIKVFYALKDTRTPVIISIISIAVNILLNLILVRHMAHKGLALATSISTLSGTLLLLYSLRRKISTLDYRAAAYTMLRVCAASALMYAAVRLLYYSTISIVGRLPALFLSIITGGLIYFLQLLFMRIDEVDRMVLMLRNRLLHQSGGG